MSSDPKAPEAMEWQGGEEENAGGDELSRTSAPSVETTVTHLARTHSADRTPRSPVGVGFLERFGQTRRGGGRRTLEPRTESLMSTRIRRLDQILGRFDSKLTISQDRQHLALSSLPTKILLIP